MNDSTPEALFESHLELALKIGRSFPIPSSSVDECEQEARIALWQAARSFDPAKGNFAGFASIVVRNHLRNAFNSAKRRSVEIAALDAPASDDPEAEIDSAKNSLVSPEASPLLDAERADIRSVLQSNLETLTPSQQQVLKSYAEGDSFAEIARRDGVSKAAVRQMAERAANQIRPELHARGITIQFMPSDAGNIERPRLPESKPKTSEGIGSIFLGVAVIGLVLFLAVLALAVFFSE
jgi:RNA polymerase sigma factor (sigma-70 family)